MSDKGMDAEIFIVTLSPTVLPCVKGLKHNLNRSCQFDSFFWIRFISFSYWSKLEMWTNCVDQSPFWEAEIRWAALEYPAFYGTQRNILLSSLQELAAIGLCSEPVWSSSHTHSLCFILTSTWNSCQFSQCGLFPLDAITSSNTVHRCRFIGKYWLFCSYYTLELWWGVRKISTNGIQCKSKVTVPRGRAF